MTHAVIQLGGKQYLVADGDKILVDKLETEEGKNITFDEVLLTVADEAVTMGDPVIKDAKVEGKVVRHGRHAKITGVKFKAKKRYRRYFGHRQDFTEVEITKISAK